MLLRDGRIRLAEYHWERLFDGIGLLRLQVPKAFREELEREVLRTVHKNGLEALCRVRLQVYAGDGGLYDEDGFRTGFVIEAFPLETALTELNENGLVVGIADAVKHSGTFSHLKTSNALPYAIAAQQARVALWNDALLPNEHGNIADSTIANIFWTEGEKIYTPPLSEGCIAGVMRRQLLETLPGLGFDTGEKPLLTKALSEADSVFLCNSIRGIRWVREIGGRIYPSAAVRELWLAIRLTLL